MKQNVSVPMEASNKTLGSPVGERWEVQPSSIFSATTPSLPAAKRLGKDS
jgi:hypothetical protein